MEGKLHGLLKKTAVRELGIEGYRVYVEPPESPMERLNWSLYRPDVLGVISSESESRFAFVECETSPSASRIRNKSLKINRSLTFQKRLNERHVFRFMLVIPAGLLDRATYPNIRRLWEIWIVNLIGEVCHRIPKNI